MKWRQIKAQTILVDLNNPLRNTITAGLEYHFGKDIKYCLC